MKTSREGPSVMKPTREELQARVESLVKKKMSIKRRAHTPLESSLAIRGKIPRLGAPSPPSTTKGWGSSDQVPARGQAPPSVAEVFKVAGPEVSSGRSVELPLAVLPISVRSPLAQDFKRPPTTPEDEGRGCFGTEGEEDSLFVIWSLPSRLCHPFCVILISRGRMPCLLRMFWPCHFKERPPYVQTPLFVLSLISICPYLCLVQSGGYLCEEPGEEGLSF